MGKTSARAVRAAGMKAFQTQQGMIDEILGYARRPFPTFQEEEARGYLSEPELEAGRVIEEILKGRLYEQPGVKTRFASAIEAPIMDFLRKETMPQIAASSGKGGTYFSTMRGRAEIDAEQAAADKIAELEGNYILNAINAAVPASIGFGELMQERWQRMQPEWGGAGVPLIQSVLPAATTAAGEGLTAAEQYEAIASQERQARMAGIESGFGSVMGAGGQIGGGAASKGGCCFLWIMSNDGEIPDYVQRFKKENFPYNSDVANGYRWMSLKLMPYITKNKFVKNLVKHLIVRPMSRFAECYYNKNPKGFIYAPVGMFWTITWALLGRLSEYNDKKYQQMCAVTN